MTGPTRAERLATPLAREALRQVTADRGGCIRPTQLRRTDTTTGERTTVLVPCGSTMEAICPACARRAKNLRATQCREGWHLDAEPDLTPAPPDDGQAVLADPARRGPGPPRPGRRRGPGHRRPRWR